MNYLLDTHIWLWAMGHRERLRSQVLSVLETHQNRFWVCPVSILEILALGRKNRLNLIPDVSTWLDRAFQTMPIQEATLTFQVARATHDLPADLTDPADRLIAASALIYELTLVTADRRLASLKNLSVLHN